MLQRSDFSDPQALQILISSVVILWKPGAVFPESGDGFVAIPFRHADDHAASCAGEQNTVGIQHILYHILSAFAGWRQLNPFCLPVESIKAPLSVVVSHICVPQQACIVKLQALHLNLCGCIFQVIRRPSICLVLYEPMSALVSGLR